MCPAKLYCVLTLNFPSIHGCLSPCAPRIGRSRMLLSSCRRFTAFISQTRKSPPGIHRTTNSFFLRDPPRSQDHTLQSTLHPLLTSLLGSLSRPLTLVQHAIALQPLHLQHLNTPYAKSRSPYLLSSSKTFLALQAQLRLEMPTYIELFDRSFAGVVIRISKLQARFWEECWTRWSLFAMGVGVDVGETGGILLSGPNGGGGSQDQAFADPSALDATSSRPSSGPVSTRRASAHSSASTSSLNLEQQRLSRATMSSGVSSIGLRGNDGRSSLTSMDVNVGKDSRSLSAGLVVAQFHDRWEAAERMLSDLSLISVRRPGGPSVKARVVSSSSAASGSGYVLGIDKDLPQHRRESKTEGPLRTSVSSSLLASANYSATFVSSPPQSATLASPTSFAPPYNRQRSDTTVSTASSLAPPSSATTLSRKNSISTVASPTSLHSMTSGGYIPRNKAYDVHAAFHTPSNVNGPPLTDAEIAKKERKRAEKAEKDAAIKLVQERAKSEKAAAKAASKTAKPNGAGAGGGSIFGVGGFLPGLVVSKESRSPSIFSKTDSTGSDPLESRRGSKLSDHSSHHGGKSPNSQLADRTRDVLFGLMPSSALDEGDLSRPSLPSLQSMNPSRSRSSQTRSNATAMSPSLATDFTIAIDSKSKHPYTSTVHSGGSSDRSPISGENGLWDSLFDASQQAYKFHPQQMPSSPDSPSTTASFTQHQQRNPPQRSSPAPPVNLSTSTATRPPRHSEPARSSHSRSHSVPPQAPAAHHVHYEEEQEMYSPPTPPSQYESLYVVSCVHPFHPPPGVIHHSLPFLSLEINDVVDILLEDGHPSTHSDLPIYVDDGDDCMLVGRDEHENIGWVLASFVMPLL